ALRAGRGVVRCGSKGQNASLTMRAFGAPVTRSFGRSTNRLVTCRAGFCFLLKQSAAAVATSREGHRLPRSGREVLHMPKEKKRVSHAMPKEKKRADRRGRPARSGDELTTTGVVPRREGHQPSQVFRQSVGV